MEWVVIIAGLAGLAFLDIAAMRWGAHSADGFRSPEWQRRAIWRSTRHES